jgi:dihydrofolate synthase/folylpolyglutamate synthase
VKLAGALAELYRRVPLGMRLGLEPMQAACRRAGAPEQALPAVHVAGTNGKGSTSAMIEAMARAGGLRTALYTSPHLCRFAERIRVDGEPIDDGALAEVLVEAAALGPDLSFFETATLAAFLAFRGAGVDLAILEVGIGGRLDATNVIPAPRCAALVNVAFDHQDKLGPTLDAIAREKAAIAKPGAPIVLGTLPAEARAAAIDVARTNGARVVEAMPLPPGTELALEGPHQRGNAAVAWTVGELLGLGEGARRRGLASARWPGRFERIATSGARYVLDGAHNPDGIAALVKALEDDHVGAVVFGVMADKDWRPMLDGLARIDAHRFYVAPAGRAPADPGAMAAFRDGTPAASVGEALAAARAVAAGRVVVVCGSLFLVGAARAALLGLPTDPAVAL